MSFTTNPAATQSSVCSCIETGSTAISTATVTGTGSAAGSTTTVTVNSGLITSTVTATTVTTTTTTSTVTATSTLRAGNSCTNTFVCGGNQGACGLNSICTCFSTGGGLKGTGAGYCSSAINSNGNCNSSSDCKSNEICVFNTCASGGACIPKNDPTCINPRQQTGERMFNRRSRMSIWSELRGRYVDVSKRGNEYMYLGEVEEIEY